MRQIYARATDPAALPFMSTAILGAIYGVAWFRTVFSAESCIQNALFNILRAQVP